MSSIRTVASPTQPNAPPVSAAHPAAPEPCLHIRTAFNFEVHASYEETAPLFGPEGERAWVGPPWDPVFVHPEPAQDIEGAVFTVRRGPNLEVWVNTLFSLDKRHFQYVYFIADLSVAVVDVRFEPAGTDLTKVDVVFTRTAISPRGNESVTAMSEMDRTAPGRWQQAIDEYLASRKTSEPD